MFDIHAAALLGQFNSSPKDNPLDWQLPLAGKLACAAVKAVWALVRKERSAPENCSKRQWSMPA
jgi:hypothetical protein